MSNEPPFIVSETASYIAAYKPPFMHCVPLKPTETETLLNWCAERYPEILRVKGKKEVEGGAVHRLDFETQGLMLFARTQTAMDFFAEQQAAGALIKEYTALSSGSAANLSSFPPFPAGFSYPQNPTIKSAFRAYGPGRKAVRPVVSEAATISYETKILQMESADGGTTKFRLQLARGFRHQIRCHLAWLGFPLLNDTLYGGTESAPRSALALNAVRISFSNPESGAIVQITL